MSSNNYTKEQFLQYFLDYTKYILKNGTAEIYKFRTVNSHTLIKELIHYLELSKGKDIFNNNIIKILEELSIELENDYITKSKNGHMDILLKPFSKYIKQILLNGKSNLTEVDKKELLIRLNSLNNKYSSTYMKYLEFELKGIFSKINNEKISGKTFIAFENLINSYVTQILFNGLSKRALMNIIYGIDHEELKNGRHVYYLNMNFFKKIEQHLSGDNKLISYLKMDVHKNGSDSVKDLIVSNKNFELHSGVIEVTEKDCYNVKDCSKINNFCNNRNSNQYETIVFTYTSESIDYVTQGNNVKEIIDKMVDFLKWEFPKGSFQLNPLCITYDIENKYYYTSYFHLDYEGHRQEGDKEYLDKRLALFKKISDGKIDEDVEGKLFTMLKYYRLGLNSGTYEERFLNLWIGWEHIFAHNLNDKTGWNNIQRYVPLMLSINHINKSLWGIIKGELNINSYGDKQKFFKFVREHNIEVDKAHPSCNLYIILQDEELFNLLLEQLEDNLIGKGKLLQLRNDLYSAKNKEIGGKTIKFIHTYNQKVTYQLYRMNRIRNSIVHTGKNHFKLLEFTTAILEKYYLEILDDILEHFTARNGFSFEDYFLRIEESYNSYIEQIKSDSFKSMEVKTRGENLTGPKIVL